MPFPPPEEQALRAAAEAMGLVLHSKQFSEQAQRMMRVYEDVVEENQRMRAELIVLRRRESAMRAALNT